MLDMLALLAQCSIIMVKSRINVGSTQYCILLYVAFCTIRAISRQKEARTREYALLLFRMNVVSASMLTTLVHFLLNAVNAGSMLVMLVMLAQ